MCVFVVRLYASSLQTLLHSQFASQRDRFRQAECRPDGASFAREADFDFTIRVNRTHRERVAVYKRPGLDTFLREAAARFEVIVFTAAIPVRVIFCYISPPNAARARARLLTRTLRCTHRSA